MSTMSSYTDQFGEKFQQHLLAVLARSPGAILRYRSALDDRFFPSRIHAVVAKALFAHADEFRTLPSLPTLIEDCRGLIDKDSMPHIETLTDKLYGADIGDYQAVLAKAVDFGKTQALCNAVVEGAERIQKGQRDKVKELVDKAQLVGEDLLSMGLNYREGMAQRAQTIDEPETTAEQIPTGITHLDFLLDGGLGRGELGVILAPPKRGKTTMLVNIGFGALVNPSRLNVVHYSCEIKEIKVARRYDIRLMGGYSKSRHSNRAGYAEEMVRRNQHFLSGSLSIKGYPTRKATVSSLRSHLSVLSAQGFPPDLVLVDYADILKAERRLGEMRHEQASIYEDLRELAGEFNCVVWTASQTNKAALEKATVTILDFAESFEKAAIVDAAIAFCQTPEEKVAQKCRLFAAALRNTDDGSTVECVIRRDRSLIRSIGLYDAANNRIDIGDVHEDPAITAASEKSEVVSTDLKDRLKQEAGITKGPKKKPPVAPGPRAPQLGTGIPEGQAKPKSDGPRKKDGPTRKVPA